MSNMEGLGRAFNVVPVADDIGISMKGASGVTFICNGTDTYTVTASPTFGGSYVTPGNILVRKYTNTTKGGTAKWVLATQAASNAVVNGGDTITAIFVGGDMLQDGAAYVKCTSTSSGLVTAILHDLTIKRSADLLPILSA